LLAFECFRDAGCELVVLEVGLGGRLDATNVVDPMLTVITRIAHDHIEYLGGTLRAIAREKAGIVKPRVPLVTGVTDAAPLSVIEEIARSKRAPMHRLRKEFDFRSVGSHAVEVRAAGHTPIVVDIGLDGAHQHANAAIAVASAFALQERGLRLTREHVKSAIAKTKWPARLERIPGRPSFLLDGAHNPDGCRALRAHLNALPARRRVLVFGAMKDKNWRGMLRILAPLFDEIVFSSVSLDRAAHPEEFLLSCEGVVAKTPAAAIARARRAAGPDGEVVVTGSLFLVAAVRAELLQCRSEPLLAM
jgi:dihydrofolate synthase/folylpolyglutamate synthase